MLFLVTYVLPAFEGFFDQLGADMPLLTKIVIGITGFASRYILIIIPAIIGINTPTGSLPRELFSKRGIATITYRAGQVAPAAFGGITYASGNTSIVVEVP